MIFSNLTARPVSGSQGPAHMSGRVCRMKIDNYDLIVLVLKEASGNVYAQFRRSYETFANGSIDDCDSNQSNDALNMHRVRKRYRSQYFITDKPSCLC